MRSLPLKPRWWDLDLIWRVRIRHVQSMNELSSQDLRELAHHEPLIHFKLQLAALHLVDQRWSDRSTDGSAALELLLQFEPTRHRHDRFVVTYGPLEWRG